MRALALIPLALLLTGACAKGEAREQNSAPQQQREFAKDCERFEGHEIPAVEARYGMRIDRGTAHIPRAAWDRMDRFERAHVDWPLAFSASCATGKLGDFRIRILDENGRELAYQMISTRLECHGDHAVIRPEDVEYRC